MAEGVGVELEVLPRRESGGRPAHLEVAEAIAALGSLRGGSTVTFEPGGQLELSTCIAPGAGPACAVLEEDLAQVAEGLARHGIVLHGSGLDPFGSPERVVRRPRYDAMDLYLQEWGGAGRVMMCATAGLQVNLDFDPGASSPATRWGLVHVVGPALAAAFANSPMAGEVPTGWRSYRLANWARIDPSRTRPAGGPGVPPEAWPSYVMDARVMMIKTGDRCHPVTSPLTFEDWARHGHPLGFPTVDDLDRHLTTLFPPVRPRGWLELRIFDSLPWPWWTVPVAVASALVYDPDAGEEAALAAWDTADLWTEAARFGLGHPALADAARACFRSALAAMPGMGMGPQLVEAVGAFAERYVARGRCPADDVLEHWRRTGEIVLPGTSSWATAPVAATAGAGAAGGAAAGAGVTAAVVGRPSPRPP